MLLFPNTLASLAVVKRLPLSIEANHVPGGGDSQIALGAL